LNVKIRDFRLHAAPARVIECFPSKSTRVSHEYIQAAQNEFDQIRSLVAEKSSSSSE